MLLNSLKSLLLFSNIKINLHNFLFQPDSEKYLSIYLEAISYLSDQYNDLFKNSCSLTIKIPIIISISGLLNIRNRNSHLSKYIYKELVNIITSFSSFITCFILNVEKLITNLKKYIIF